MAPIRRSWLVETVSYNGTDVPESQRSGKFIPSSPRGSGEKMTLIFAARTPFGAAVNTESGDDLAGVTYKFLCRTPVDR
ncbi:unnamed protein product, partial [Iphiclides podalirius]